MPRNKPKNLEREIAEKVNQKIENVDPEIEKEIDAEINKVFAEEIKQRVKSEIEQRIGNQVTEEQTPNPRQLANSISLPVVEFRQNISRCLRGVCRYTAFILLAADILAALIYFGCRFLGSLSFCNAGTFSSQTSVILISAIAVFISVIISFISSYSRTSLILDFFLAIPLLIILSIYTLQYIGLLVIALVIFARMSQGYRR